MTHYLSYTFNDTPEFVATFDELPLWSAPFGLLMLEHLELRRDITVLDIGSGAGFPLIELAERLGSPCRVYGLDPWTNANARARRKIAQYAVAGVEIIEGSAERIPFEPESIDLIVSNLGINNVDHPESVFDECRRVLKPGGRLAVTTNLNGHWREFYDLFEETLAEMGRPDLVDALTRHQQHRGTPESVGRLFTGSGLAIRRSHQENFTMRFLDGSAFLNHHFVKLGWLESWRSLLPTDILYEVFSTLEAKLNAYAAASGGLSLTVPMLYMEGEKA